MKRTTIIGISASLLALASTARAQGEAQALPSVEASTTSPTIFSTWIAGDISDITSTKSGLYVRFPNNAKPSACLQTSPWLVIAAEDEAMIAVTLSHWMGGQRTFTVYVDPNASPSYCMITQVDPR